MTKEYLEKHGAELAEDGFPEGPHSGPVEYYRSSAELGFQSCLNLLWPVVEALKDVIDHSEETSYLHIISKQALKELEQKVGK